MLNRIASLLIGFAGLRLSEWLVLSLTFFVSVYFPTYTSVDPAHESTDIPAAFSLMAMVIIGYGYPYISAAAYVVGRWLSKKGSSPALPLLNAVGFACFAAWFIWAKLPDGIWAPWVVAITVAGFNWYSGRVVATWLARRDAIRAL